MWRTCGGGDPPSAASGPRPARWAICWAGSAARRAAGSSPRRRSARASGSTAPRCPPASPPHPEAFATGAAGLRHVEVIARVLDAASVQRLTPETWAGAEAQLAAKAPEYTPSGLQAWGDALVALLDQDGAEPDDRPPAQVNELHLARHRSGGGGRLKGRFDAPRWSTRSPRSSTTAPHRAPPTTTGRRAGARPRPSPTPAGTCSTTATMRVARSRPVPGHGPARPPPPRQARSSRGSTPATGAPPRHDRRRGPGGAGRQTRHGIGNPAAARSAGAAPPHSTR